MKPALFHPSAIDALRAFPESVRRALGKAILELQNGHLLTMPLSRPMPSVAPGVSELRVHDSDGIYRVFYLVRLVDAVVVFHAFQKKTTKTPDREIDLGRKRLKELIE